MRLYMNGMSLRTNVPGKSVTWHKQGKFACYELLKLLDSETCPTPSERIHPGGLRHSRLNKFDGQAGG